MSIETAVALVTRNVARVLKLGNKGRVQQGLDADLMLTDERFQIQHVFARGSQVVRNGKPMVFGTFENTPGVPGSPDSKATAGKEDLGRGRSMISPDEGEDDFPDAQERQQKSNRRHYCC